ncbi:oxidoreductase, short chain dehydrogenase/reductase family protein [Ditylenchus destructor]|uniref:Oxidoreductase, short chain dehydrogenase/reductase family protein n=1 Tax=Ditylenchus destructor TaxID=166010 RepID=A0AAD4MSB2_9BILA|nr:oxidoreductase, short chain dehydrogenase/reductase family protein [Ditylenchus destructor]
MVSKRDSDGKITSTLGAILHLVLVAFPKDLWRWMTLRRKCVKDQVVVITGGASGLGQRMAEMFAWDLGAKVAILDVDEEYLTAQRLLSVETLLGRVEPKVQLGRSGPSSMTLTYLLVVESTSEEELRVTINAGTDTIECKVNLLGPSTEVTELASALTAEVSRIEVSSTEVSSTEVSTASLDRISPLVVTFKPDDQVGVLLEFFLFSSGKEMQLDMIKVTNSASVLILEGNDVIKVIYENFLRNEPVSSYSSGPSKANLELGAHHSTPQVRPESINKGAWNLPAIPSCYDIPREVWYLIFVFAFIVSVLTVASFFIDIEKNFPVILLILLIIAVIWCLATLRERETTDGLVQVRRRSVWRYPQ